MSDTRSTFKGTTAELTVNDMSFMLDRLGKDCAPLQFLRELTQNSIEAILRTPEKSGDIVWDVDWTTFDLTGLYKLSITDTGCGMTGEEMMKFINQLSSSAATQSHQGNYGVGAKVAAGTINPEGLVYLSWVDGKGAMVHFWRDPDDGKYGLKQLEIDSSTFDYWARPDSELKPSLIQEHGTKVVLFGKSVEHNTMNAPQETQDTTKWVRKYLNSRFFRFPEGIRLRVREGWTEPREDTDLNVLREVTGMEKYVGVHMGCYGVVSLRNARARWWILKDEAALGGNSGFIESSGHVAVLYKDELYELRRSRSGTTLLQQFGVIFGMRRVVIYIEPDSEELVNITTNTARTHLLVNGERLPWTEWANEFRENMPEEIVELMLEVAEGKSSDHGDSIKNRLKHIQHLFNLSRYRPIPSGAVLVDPAERYGGGEPKRHDYASRRGSSRSGGPGGSEGNIYSIFVAHDGVPADEARGKPWPKVDWVSVKNGTRQPGDMEDRAAKYLSDQHRLLINADFRVFTDMIDHWESKYGGAPGVRTAVVEVVREWFEQTLIEAVMGAAGLRGSRQWTPEERERALSEEALTAVVLPRYHTDVAVARSLGSKLGTLKTKAS